MKADLDRLMRERDMDAIIVAGGEEFNAARYYLSNGAQITHGAIFKALCKAGAAGLQRHGAGRSAQERP